MLRKSNSDPFHQINFHCNCHLYEYTSRKREKQKKNKKKNLGQTHDGKPGRLKTRTLQFMLVVLLSQNKCFIHTIESLCKIKLLAFDSCHFHLDTHTHTHTRTHTSPKELPNGGGGDRTMERVRATETRPCSLFDSYFYVIQYYRSLLFASRRFMCAWLCFVLYPSPCVSNHLLFTLIFFLFIHIIDRPPIMTRNGDDPEHHILFLSFVYALHSHLNGILGL